MILIGNINLNNLISQNEKQSLVVQSFDSNNLFDKFLNLLLENEENQNESAPFLLPNLSFQNLILQDLQKMQELLNSLNISADIKSLLIKWQINSEELSNIIKNLQNIDNKDLLNFLKTLNESNENKLDIQSLRELANDLKAKNNESHQTDVLLENIKKIVNSKENSHSDLNLFKELSLDNLNNKTEKNILSNRDSHKFKIESLVDSEVQLSSIINKEVTTSNNQQKIELPFTRLQEISNILFKAVSNSSKTLIVHLEPPELGKILIKLSMDSAGIKADMKVDYPYVKEALTALIPEIKSNLQSSGVKISDFLLDLMRDYRGYSDSYNNQGQRKNKNTQKFFEYFA
ncbi:flagellar hook-length control protein FliK [Thermodesulfovibrio sp. 1176]|nr:flagellar hook-length control protein FliK [Thermodesulfovibrio sp. 1176]